MQKMVAHKLKVIEAFFPFQHAFHEKNLFSLVSAPEIMKKKSTSGWHTSLKKAFAC